MYFKTKYLECEICKQSLPLSVKLNGKFYQIKKATWHYRNWETESNSIFYFGSIVQRQRFTLRPLCGSHNFRWTYKISKINKIKKVIFSSIKFNKTGLL